MMLIKKKLYKKKSSGQIVSDRMELNIDAFIKIAALLEHNAI